MTDREKVLEAVLRELVSSLDELGCPYCWRKRGEEAGSRAEVALNAAREVVAAVQAPTLRVFGKRREGLSRSEINYPGRYEDQ